MEGEFFNETSVDDGVMFGFHRMNAFAGLERLATHHFHDMEKNADVEKELKDYRDFLSQTENRFILEDCSAGLINAG